MQSREPKKVEQPPILDEVDEKILDKIWDERGKQDQRSNGDKSRFTDDIVVEIKKSDGNEERAAKPDTSRFTDPTPP